MNQYLDFLCTMRSYIFFLFRNAGWDPLNDFTSINGWVSTCSLKTTNVKDNQVKCIKKKSVIESLYFSSNDLQYQLEFEY